MRHQTILLILGVIPGFAAELGNSLPLSFIPNTGETNPSIRFITETPDLQAGFGANSVTFRVRDHEVRLNFSHADPNVKIDGAGLMPGRANFMLGQDRNHWRTGLPTYAQIAYHGLYPGIDLIYSGTGNRVKSEFVIAPGADPARIRLDYDHAEEVLIDSDGSLVVKNPPVELREEAPVVYQESGDERVPVEGHFHLLGPHTVGFELGAYDRTKPLIIDPVVSYCTYLGGTGIGSVTGVAVDAVGNLYVSGWTEALNFPMAGGVQNANKGSVDAFVLKLNPGGTSIIYSTYIGGRSDDRAAAIAVDSNGYAYVTGYTTSANFPVVSPVRSTLGGTRNAFALKLNPAGNALVYSTYLGGSNYDMGNAIAVDTAGNAYLAGDTYSTDFPLSHPVQSSLGGLADAFITKLTAAGAISFSTFLGGSNLEHAGGIAVDSTSNVYVAGGTASTNFPTSGAIQAALGGGQNAFVAKINTSSFTLVYSTYLGGNGGSPATPEEANAIAVDGSGDAYVAGVTNSTNFPVSSSAFQPAYDGAQDAFISKLNPAGNSLVYSTYLGGSSFDWANGIAVDSSGNAYVAGYTLSADFPTDGGVQDTPAGLYDAFITKLNPAGSALVYSTYYGGTGSDTANALAIDAYGNIFVGGQTGSFNLPLQGAIQTANNGGSTGWVMRLGFVTPPPPPPQAVSVTPAAGSGSTQTFSFVFADPNGAADLTSLQALFNTSSSNVNACNISVDPVHGTFSLANNAGSSFATPLNLGASGTLSNSQCTVNGVGSTVSSSGNNLTLTLAVSFEATFNDAQNIYGYAQTAEALNSGWVQLGAYTVFVSSPAQTPQAASVTPSAGAGSGQTFSLVFTDVSGTADINSVIVGFGTGIWSASSCFLQLDATHTLVSLTNDATTVWMTPITLGSAATTQNSQCTVNGALSSVSSSGGTLTLNLGLAFQPSFAGARTIFAYVASADGLNSGWQMLGTYTVTTASGSVASPVFAPASGIYTSAQSVTISTPTAGASIRYTTNGTTPTETVGTLYSAPFTVSASETVEAIAYKSGMTDSAVVDAVYTISPPVAAAVFTPVAGTYTSAQSVSITTTTPGASIRYTTNGTTPTETVGTLYSSAFTVSGSETIMAIAYETGMTDSAVVSAIYTISLPVAAPVFTPLAGTYSSAQSVGITTTTPGASIRYTTNGSTPTETVGTLYSAPFTVSSSETIKAIAYEAGMTDSVVASAVYTINLATPTNSAVFVKTDLTTQGTWTGVYGSSGYNVIGANAVYPSDVTVTPNNESYYLWANSTTDVRDLQMAPSSTARVAATWFSFTTFTVDIAFTDTAQHQLAIYCLDWNQVSRTQTISILDGNSNAVLDSRNLADFGNGEYLVWKVSGNVIIQVTNTGSNAVISGLFFDPGAITSTPVTSPVFTPVAGTYSSAQSIGITTTTPGASIRYTTNGSTPTETVGTLYSGPFAVGATETVEAIAYETGMTDSAVVSAIYTISALVAAPVFTPVAGTYSSAQSIGITTTTPGASIRYTTNGSTPTETVGTLYSGPFAVGATETVEAIAYETGMTDSAVVSAIYTISALVAAPVFTPVAGAYSSAQSIGITTTTPGASIRYTTNGSTPTETVGTLYSGPFAVGATETVEAIAYETGMTDSAVVSAIYTISALVAAPVFTPVAGTYSSAQSVGIATTTPGASIRYTTNGNTPSETTGTLYSGPFTVGATETVEAIAYETGMTDSAVVSAIYTISALVAAPVFTPVAGTYSSAQSIGITTTTPGASIRYTTNGSTPTETVGTLYSGPFAVGATETVEAIAYETGMTDSAVVSAIYTISALVAAPVFTPVAGTYSSAQSIGITTTTPGASIRYTTNGSTPTETVGTLYSGPFTVGATETVEAIAYETGMTDSAVVSAIYTISALVAAPVFTPVAGAYSSAQSISITTSTPGASIRYTTNGSTPTETVGTLYSAPFTVSSSVTIKAMAYEAGMTDSMVASVVYTINIATPTNSAVFVKTDLTTKGTWTGVYGSSGYNVIGANAVYPSDVTVTPNNESYYLWANSNTDVRDLQMAPSSTARIAATWFSFTTFTVDLVFTDTAQHQLAIYCLDWNQVSRTQTISILDGNSNAVLDSRNLANFGNGEYLVWKVSGNVIIQVTNTGSNAVISGLFFD